MEAWVGVDGLYAQGAEGCGFGAELTDTNLKLQYYILILYVCNSM